MVETSTIQPFNNKKKNLKHKSNNQDLISKVYSKYICRKSTMRSKPAKLAHNCCVYFFLKYHFNESN